MKLILKNRKKAYMVMLFTTVTHCLGPTAYVSSLLGFLWWTIEPNMISKSQQHIKVRKKYEDGLPLQGS